MNEQVGKKRDWIKNAIIVFLIIMLLLTFFSNTIMNYSLPEVSAQYVTSGTIQAKVRGSGVISAGNPYSVKSEVSKTIMSVAVKDGSVVNKGDVLFYLEEGESTDLKDALKLLDDLQDAYRQKALAAGVDPDETNRILNGQFTDYNTYYVKVQNLKREIKALEDDIKVFEKEIAKVQKLRDEAEKESGGKDSEEKRLAYETSKAAREAAEKALGEALTAAGVANVAEAQTKLDTIMVDVEAAKKAVNDIKTGTAYQQAEALRKSYENAVASAIKAVEDATTDAERQAAQEAWNKAEADLKNHNETAAVYTELKQAENRLQAAQDSVSDSQTKLNAVLSADQAFVSAKASEETAKKAYESVSPDHSVAISQYDNVIKLNQDYVDGQKAKITEKQTEVADLLAQMEQDNAMSKELEAIAEQRELIEKLRNGNDANEIVAPISGVVSGIMLKAGDSTPLNGEVCTIVPEGTGYTMEVTVTKEQAQRLSKGDVADIQNAWYYSNVTAVLEQIKADKSDPANKKVLVFAVEGDVSDGQSLSISIGQKSANYDYLVPNSAIREDNNGKFILKVSQKSSPLGNRYYAERVDIEVLASDDTKSAIKGALEGWEFVITTSTKPVEAGQLIRLQD